MNKKGQSILILFMAFICTVIVFIGFCYILFLGMNESDRNKEDFCKSIGMELHDDSWNFDYCYDKIESKMWAIKTVGHTKMGFWNLYNVETDFRIVKEVVTLE